jgi:hypothetical protein
MHHIFEPLTAVAQALSDINAALAIETRKEQFADFNRRHPRRRRKASVPLQLDLGLGIAENHNPPK